MANDNRNAIDYRTASREVVLRHLQAYISNFPESEQTDEVLIWAGEPYSLRGMLEEVEKGTPVGNDFLEEYRRSLVIK